MSADRQFWQDAEEICCIDHLATIITHERIPAAGWS